MGNGYFQSGYKDRITYFDVFFRKVPDGGGFAIAAGLEQLIDYIENLHFTEEDIAYLRGRNLFCEEFLDYLKNFRFTGDIYAIPEGTPVFPKEPLVIVRAPAIEAQLIETFTLLTINHQSLIATKANRIVRAARGHHRRQQRFHLQAQLRVIRMAFRQSGQNVRMRHHKPAHRASPDVRGKSRPRIGPLLRFRTVPRVRVQAAFQPRLFKDQLHFARRNRNLGRNAIEVYTIPAKGESPDAW